jgi:hypothetical protein
MKVIIDILLFIFMLLEFSKNYMDPTYHEIFGIILIILLIIHLILNKNYIKTIFKGKYNLSRIIMLIINTCFLITLLLSIVFGILSSQELFKFLNIGSFTLIKFHKILSYLSLIFMGLHLGINFNYIIRKINKKLMYIIEIIVIIYGIYSFIKLEIINHITGFYGFSIIDSNVFINIIRYLSIVLMIAFISHNLYKLIKKGK